MRLYTGKGDGGSTGLLNNMTISKNHPLIHLLGEMDEFTSALGLARTYTKDEDLVKDILHIQKEIINFNSQVAGGDIRITHENIACLENMIDKYMELTGEVKGFVLPGETGVSAALDLARSVVRRAERTAAGLKEERKIGDVLFVYLNRMSDLIYAMARYTEKKEAVKEIVMKVMDELGLNEASPTDGKITLDVAKKLVEKVEKKAMETGVKVVIAVADDGGNLVLLHRMDDALIASIDIAINKAYTSVALKMSTRKAGELSRPGSPLYGLHSTNGNRIVIFGGGVPLLQDGKVIGGLGVSGGTAEQDAELAEYGLEIFEKGV